MRLWLRLWLLLIILSLVTSLSASQHNNIDDTLALRSEFQQKLNLASDSLVLTCQETIDSLSFLLDSFLIRHTSSLKVLTDSLLTTDGRSLDPSRKDSAHQLNQAFSSKLDSYCQTQKQSLHHQFIRQRQAILKLKKLHEPCVKCSKVEDYEDELSAYRDNANDSLEVFYGSAIDQLEMAKSNLADSSETFRDSLASFIEILINESDYIEEHSQKLIITVDAHSYNSYRGRDNGLKQATISPSITYRPLSGLQITAGALWMEKQPNPWYGKGIGLGYDFTLLSSLGGSLGYTAFWYKDSINQSNSTLDHFIDGELDFETPIVNLTAAISIDVNDPSELGIMMRTSHRWEKGIISFEPALILTWGNQSWEEDIDKTITLHPHKNPTDSTYTLTYQHITFSIMSYEVCLPLSLHFGRLLLTPSVTFVFPVNVLDGSRSTPFLFAGLTATIDWIL